MSTGRTFPTGVGAPILLEGLQVIGRVRPLSLIHRSQALLHAVHSALTAEVVQSSLPGSRGSDDVQSWVETIEAAALRCLRLLGDIIASGRFDLATLSVALREIQSLAHAGPPESLQAVARE